MKKDLRLLTYKKYKSFKWMLIATFCFSIMGLMVKLLSSLFNEYELVFYRSFISLVIVVFIIRNNGVSYITKYRKIHFARSFIGFISLILFFYAITKLPLGTSMTLNYTSPIFVGLLIPFFMKQRFHKHKLLLIMIGFIGIVFILKPVFDSNLFAGLIGLLSGFGAAIAYIMVAKLGQLKEPDLRTVFYFTFLSSICSFVMMVQKDINTLYFDINLLYLISLGVSATLAQIAITRAYREGKALNNAAYSYLTVVFSVIWGVLVFNDAIDLYAASGIVLIFISGFLVNKK
jgi:drug/metabolite transporter (DMT)-like permease